MAKIIDRGFAKPGDRIFSSGWTTSSPVILKHPTSNSQKNTDEKLKLVANNRRPKPVTREELDRRQFEADLLDGFNAQQRREGLPEIPDLKWLNEDESS